MCGPQDRLLSCDSAEEARGVLSAVEGGPLGYDSHFSFAHLSLEHVESIRWKYARKVGRSPVFGQNNWFEMLFLYRF